MAEVTIFEERTVSGFTYNSYINAYQAGGAFGTDFTAFTIELGKTYTVVWDGVDYEVTAKDASAVESGVILLGNGSDFGLGGEEPFAVAWYPEGFTLFCYDDATSHTVAIYKDVATGATILEEQTVEYNAEDDGCFIPYAEPLITGETYIVVWNGVVYECVATDFTINENLVVPVIGNPGDIGAGDDNGVPFVVMYADSELSGTGASLYSVVFLDGSTSATLAIYQAAEEESGNVLGKLFQNIANSIRGKTGGTDKMAPAVFPETIDSIDQGPEILPEVIIEPNFADGDCVDSAPEGYAIQNFTVKKPDTLVPENILSGVNIAGVIGAAVAGGGGGSAVVASGVFEPTASTATITHGLGVVPDLILVFCKSAISGSDAKVHIALGTSTAFKDNLSLDAYGGGWVLFSSGVLMGLAWDITSTSHPAGGIHKATESTFTIGSSGNAMDTTLKYCWIAIGGLT